MAEITRQQFDNLLFLRDTVIPWMERNPERVDLDHINGGEGDCGTTHCLMGWYSVMRYKKDWVDMTLERAAHDWMALDIGVSMDDYFSLTTTAKHGTLATRKSRLNAIIAEHALKFEQAMPFNVLMSKLTSGTLEPMEEI